MYLSLCLSSVLVLLELNLFDGFLLDGSNANTGNLTLNGNGQSQYITIDEFLKFESQQHQTTEQLRGLLQRSLGLLSSQLKNELSQIEAKINAKNSCDGNLQNLYSSLRSNFTYLQQQLSLTKDENKKLKDELNLLLTKTNAISNNTSYNSQRITSIVSSNGIQSQLNLTRLSTKISSVEAKTIQLEQTLIARSQDILAMYNDTTYLKRTISDFKAQTSTDLQTYSNNTRNQIERLEGKFDDKYSLLRTNLSDKIAIVGRRVALTACSSKNQNENSGYILKFATVKTVVGFKDITSFTNTGKFRCEYDGIYLVNADLTIYHTNIDYDIYVNGNVYERVYEEDNKVHYQRGVISITLDLHSGDSIWIQLRSHVYVDILSSCFTIVKIK